MINVNGNLFANIDSKNINDFTFIINNFNFSEEIHFENGLLFFWEDHFFISLHSYFLKSHFDESIQFVYYHTRKFVRRSKSNKIHVYFI